MAWKLTVLYFWWAHMDAQQVLDLPRRSLPWAGPALAWAMRKQDTSSFLRLAPGLSVDAGVDALV